MQLKNNQVPGPGKYETTFNPEVKLYYTMRNKNQKKNTHWNVYIYYILVSWSRSVQFK